MRSGMLWIPGFSTSAFSFGCVWLRSPPGNVVPASRSARLRSSTLPTDRPPLIADLPIITPEHRFARQWNIGAPSDSDMCVPMRTGTRSPPAHFSHSDSNMVPECDVRSSPEKAGHRGWWSVQRLRRAGPGQHVASRGRPPRRALRPVNRGGRCSATGWMTSPSPLPSGSNRRQTGPMADRCMRLSWGSRSAITASTWSRIRSITALRSASIETPSSPNPPSSECGVAIACRRCLAPLVIQQGDQRAMLGGSPRPRATPGPVRAAGRRRTCTTGRVRRAIGPALP